VTKEKESENEICPFKESFNDKYHIGVALNRFQVNGIDSLSKEIAETHFNSITSENDMKWMSIHPRPGEYFFDEADKFVEFGEQNNMFIIGHCIMWHSQVPFWVFIDADSNLVSRDTLLYRLKDHINTVVGRYKGRVHGWDVVNEALNDNGTIRETLWYKIIGEDFIQKAFEYVHEADPDAELYYNDYNMSMKAKREGAVRILKPLIDKGIRIDAIGMQGHYESDWPTLGAIDSSIVRFGELGTKVMITELEITILPSAFRGAEISTNVKLKKELNPYVDGLPDSAETILTNRYVDMFDLFNKRKDVISRVTLWGVTDKHSWRNNFPVRGRTDYPLLFDRDYQPKKAFFDIQDLYSEEK
jgi:endo-1,4-beta-xylanase